MRARAVIATVAVAFGLYGVAPAGAADLVSAPGGVVVRPNWRAPWHGRHYFPATGRRPKVGRDENLSAHRAPLRRAASYERHWWVSSVNAPEFPPRGRGNQMEPSLK